MPSRVSRGVESLLRTTHTMLLQIAVSVAAALCVAFITNAYLDERVRPAAGEQPPVLSEAPAVTPPGDTLRAATARPTAELPRLEAEVIADLPAIPNLAHEVFPGVPADMSVESLRQSVEPTKPAPRRVFGLAIPFT